MFKDFGGGAISDLGAHQIDLFNWMYNALPKSVIATGGIDYFTSSTMKTLGTGRAYELYDNVMSMYEYDLPNDTFDTATHADGADHVTSRAYYQVITTNGSQGFYEKYMGINGTVSLSEVPTVNQIYQEPGNDWEPYTKTSPPLVTEKIAATKVHHKFWQKPKPWTRPEKWLDTANNIAAGVSKNPAEYQLPVTLDLLPHAPHLENFFEVVRSGGGQEDLNCPVEEAYRTCVTVLKINESIETGQRVDFKPEDFVV